MERAVSLIEEDNEVKVVVFDSAVGGFFATHDFLTPFEESAKFPPGRTGLRPLPDMLARLSRPPVASIALIRGRATGVGSETRAGVRYAVREPGKGGRVAVGGGSRISSRRGPMARLPRLIGRGRALEVLLGADDVSGELAEIYGYVNRSLPDAEFDEFVDKLARRVASFDKQAIAETKRLVNLASLPRIRRLRRNGRLHRFPRTKRRS
jgi:enoyl-CoA hydratase/carnithine racemase